ncbi:SRPBCC domain-containing protein [Vibrio sp. SCSIO 43132]|uniref:SRPBCC family protein n=1 Tax=Vibrio sp. SCSIO 43132 TaxID=2779363 RepID=UPI001CA7BDFE|nr:SRPBCC domain-containing protein [Vibrio sp. SCSIO 43132]UAB71884.1 SRPBCC domain-containing protein [Vibrio sp. SCSIO 43132]
MNDQIVEPTILTREYDAPIQLVFEAWTKVEHLSKWMVPMPGVSCEFTKADIKAGGESLHKMTMPNGFEMWLYSKYLEIVEPHTVVFVQSVSNEQGEILPSPQMPSWPKEMKTTVKLEENGSKTKLQLIWEPVNASSEEVAAFDSSREQHGAGWGSGLESLEKYLSEV